MLPNRNERSWRRTKTAWCCLAAGLILTGVVLAQDSASVRRLFEQLRSQDPLRRGEAARTLLQIAPSATAALEVFLEALLEADESVRQTAAEALVRMGPKIVPDLAKVLESPSKTLRRRVAVVLGQMGPAAKAAVPALEKALQDADGDTRAFAALALVRIHPARHDLVPLLRPLLNEPDTSLRVSLVYALELLIKDQPNAIQLLELATRDAVWEVRLAAIAVLGRAGQAAKSTQAALKQRLADEHGLVRVSAVHALLQIGETGTAELVPILQKELQHNDASVRRAAVLVLPDCGVAGRAAIPQLQVLAQNDPDPVVRHLAAQTLRVLMPPG